jgi:hypothetical protein
MVTIVTNSEKKKRSENISYIYIYKVYILKYRKKYSPVLID